MSDTPWSGDVVGLVEAFRAGERSPSEELEATLAAVERATSMRSATLMPRRLGWLRPPPMSHSRTGCPPCGEGTPGGRTAGRVAWIASPRRRGVRRRWHLRRTAEDRRRDRRRADDIQRIRRHQSDHHQDPRATRNPWNLERTPAAARAVRLRVLPVASSRSPRRAMAADRSASPPASAA